MLIYIYCLFLKKSTGGKDIKYDWIVVKQIRNFANFYLFRIISKLPNKS